MITRSIGKIVRGRSTPFQVVAASVLGACLGFLPGFAAAPGLAATLLVLLAVLNANLFVAGAVAAGAYLASLALQPALFAVGRFLLDGPTTDLFRRAVNAPVLAYFGLERYVTTGGLAVGLVLGVVVGLALAWTQRTLRTRLAAAEEGSERYQRLTSKRSVRVASYVLFGKRPKQGYGALTAKRVGNPVRVVGLVGVLAAGGLAYAGNAVLGSAYLRNTLQEGLERANGATVDVAGLELDLSAGRFAVEGLAVADADELTRDVFRGLSFEADLSTEALLTKRLVVERLVVRRASSGEERAIPGERVDRGEAGDAQDDAPASGAEGELSLEDVLADVELWRERLERARRLLDRFAGGEEDVAAGAEPGAPAPADETLRERLERRAAEQGYGAVVATHLLDAVPRVRVDAIVVDEFRLADVPGELFELRVENLSSAPSLLEAGPRVALRSSDGDVELAFELGARGSAATAAAPLARAAHLRLALRGVPVDRLAGDVVVRGNRVVEGGTLDVTLDGAYAHGGVDLPLAVALTDTTLTVPGYAPTRVARFELPIGVRGPLDAPRLSVDDDELIDALVEAGKDELARRVRAEVDARLADARDDLEGRLRDELGGRLGDELDGVLDDALTGNLDDAGAALEQAAADAAAKAAEEARQAAEETARKEAEKRAGGALGGLLGGRRTRGGTR